MIKIQRLWKETVREKVYESNLKRRRNFKMLGKREKTEGKNKKRKENDAKKDRKEQNTEIEKNRLEKKVKKGRKIRCRVAYRGSEEGAAAPGKLRTCSYC